MSGRKPRSALSLLLALSSLACAGAHAGASAGTSAKGIAYRWVDEQGVVHYGDRIPPQAAERERTSPRIL